MSDNSNTIQAYTPTYYPKFLCDSSVCKNNCCSRGWIIRVDNDTYSKYMALEGPEREQFEGKFTHSPSGIADQILNLDKEGLCSFINDKGLCDIQLKLGYEYLCLTCRIYPRRICLVDNAPEAYMQPSCEIAAKQILFEKNFIKMEENTIFSGPFKVQGDHIGYSHNLDFARYSKHPKAVEIFWKLRSASLAIMQSRQYKMRFRMLILLLFIQEAADLLAAGQDASLIPLSDNYIERMFGTYFNELYKEMPNGVERDFTVALDILKDIVNKNLKTSHLLREYLDLTMQGFDISYDDWKLPENFNDHYDKYYNMFLPPHEQIFENYFSHDILCEGFPFNYGQSNNLLENYAKLLAKYNLVEFIITGATRRSMKFDKRVIINLVARFSCCYEHSISGFLKNE